jgi:hypothetical protein
MEMFFLGSKCTVVGGAILSKTVCSVLHLLLWLLSHKPRGSSFCREVVPNRVFKPVRGLNVQIFDSRGQINSLSSSNGSGHTSSVMQGFQKVGRR